MQVIHKYIVNLGTNTLMLSDSAEILTAGAQQHNTVVWVRNPSEPGLSSPRTVLLAYTGRELAGEDMEYLATCTDKQGYVTHVFVDKR